LPCFIPGLSRSSKAEFSSFGQTYKPKQYKKQVVSVDNLCALTTAMGRPITTHSLPTGEKPQYPQPSSLPGLIINA